MEKEVGTKYQETRKGCCKLCWCIKKWTYKSKENVPLMGRGHIRWKISRTLIRGYKVWKYHSVICILYFKVIVTIGETRYPYPWHSFCIFPCIFFIMVDDHPTKLTSKNEYIALDTQCRPTCTFQEIINWCFPIKGNIKWLELKILHYLIPFTYCIVEQSNIISYGIQEQSNLLS